MADLEAPRIIFASPNLLQTQLGIWGPAEVGRYAVEAGYDGVEWHALHTQHYPETSIARAVESGDLPLNSLHASFRTNQASRNTNAMGGNPKLIDRLIDSPIGALVMPETTDSARYLGNLQRQLPMTVPAVLFPQQELGRDRAQVSWVEGYAAHPRAQVLFQPTDHVARLVGVPTFPRFCYEMLQTRGYSGFALDTFHARRRYGEREAGPISDRNRLPDLLSRSGAVQLSLNRVDLQKGEDHIYSKQELQDALTGEYRGYIREVLDGVKEHHIPFITVELAAAGLRKAAKRQGMTIQEGYARIASNLREYFTS